jgi:polyvinyl alcohol dehydrogenase (cytochrome)
MVGQMTSDKFHASQASRKLTALIIALGALALGACAPDNVVETSLADDQPSLDDMIRAAIEADADHPGLALYEANCATCHNGSVVEAPSKDAISLQGSEALVRVMAFGIMKPQAAHLTSIERRHIAEYLGDPTVESAETNALENQCETEYSPGTALWSQWGGDKTNSRYAKHSTLDADEIGSLELKWAFGFPGAARARSQPAVTSTTLFTGSQSGMVYALDRETGCIHWTYSARAEVRTALFVETDEAGMATTLYFADFDANVYSLDLATGEERWVRDVKDHPAGTITGSVVMHEDRLFVPMSSLEVVSAYTPEYECCTFRGGMLALDAKTGKTLWRMYTVPEPQETGTNSVGAKQFGPSGVPIWNSPTVDAKRGLLYAGTGENYSTPATGLSDSILAISMETGELVWKTQTIEGDAWNASCGPRNNRVNCPEEDGPDFDFGAPPILATDENGRDILLAGQKSGMIYAMNAEDEGRIIWERREGMGGFNGGVHWGMALKDDNLFVGIADTPGNRFATGESQQGMHVRNINSNSAVWSVLEPNVCDEFAHKCMTALSAPPTVSDTAVFAGSLNGFVKIYDVNSGAELWSTHTLRAYDTVNGIDAKGGSIDSAGVLAVGDQVITNSGYDKFGQIPGNVLLVYEPRDDGVVAWE